MVNFFKYRWFGLALAAVVLGLDFLTKEWVLEALWLRGGVEVIPGFFNLVLAFNPGVAFSMLQFDSDISRWGLTLFAVIVSGWLVWWMGKETGRWHRWGCGLVIGGALGNALDRVMHGAVVDFLDFHYNGIHWPAFNLADSAICVGVACLLLSSFFANKNE